MWTQIYTGFQLPVWLLRKCQFPATKKAVTFFFSYFVVESLNRCNAKFIMTTLYRYFSATERPVYHSVLETVFNHLEYRQMLNKTMLDLMRYDCLELYNNSIYVTNRGTMIPSVNCCVCQMPIDGGRGVGMLAFECGHCFHDNTRCGGFKVCPLCQGNFVNQIQPEIINVTEKGRQIQLRKLQRFEYGLKKRYGNDGDYSNVGNNVYFLVDLNQTPTKKATLNLPKKVPDIPTLFLEL